MSLGNGYKVSHVSMPCLLYTSKLSDELRGTDAEIERGDRIRRAIQVACRNEVRMKRNSADVYKRQW